MYTCYIEFRSLVVMLVATTILIPYPTHHYFGRIGMRTTARFKWKRRTPELAVARKRKVEFNLPWNRRNWEDASFALTKGRSTCSLPQKLERKSRRFKTPPPPSLQSPKRRSDFRPPLSGTEFPDPSFPNPSYLDPSSNLISNNNDTKKKKKSQRGISLDQVAFQSSSISYSRSIWRIGIRSCPGFPFLEKNSIFSIFLCWNSVRIEWFPGLLGKIGFWEREESWFWTRVLEMSGQGGSSRKSMTLSNGQGIAKKKSLENVNSEIVRRNSASSARSTYDNLALLTFLSYVFFFKFYDWML